MRSRNLCFTRKGVERSRSSQKFLEHDSPHALLSRSPGSYAKYMATCRQYSFSSLLIAFSQMWEWDSNPLFTTFYVKIALFNILEMPKPAMIFSRRFHVSQEEKAHSRHFIDGVITPQIPEVFLLLYFLSYAMTPISMVQYDCWLSVIIIALQVAGWRMWKKVEPSLLAETSWNSQTLLPAPHWPELSHMPCQHGKEKRFHSPGLGTFCS